MRDKAVFRIIYGILLAGIILFTDFAVEYVQGSIDEYEASQPEHVVNATLEKFTEAAKNGKADEMLTYPDVEVSPYEGALYAEYNAGLASVSEWKWKILSGSYSEERQVYGFYGDDELLAKMVLNCRDSRIIMEILTANTWEAGEIYPSITLTRYTEYIDIPVGFSATLNGIPVTKESPGVEWTEKNGNILYTIDNLYNLKEVQIYDSYGRPCEVVNDNGYVTAKTQYYNLILPVEYRVFDGNNAVAGVTEKGGIHYRYTSSSETLTIKDIYGNEIRYSNGDTVPSLDVSFVIPDNFTVEWGDNDPNDYLVRKEKISMYADYDKFVTMPQLARYEIKGLLKLPELKIRDNFGLPVDYTFNGNYFEITEQTALAEVPEDILAAADPVAIIKTWSLFNSNDLTGRRHGFGTLQKYLVPNTDFYIQAEKYSREEDLSFASTHNTPEFIAENVSDYVYYSDDLFSCHVYLEKKMFIVQNQADIIDTTSSTFFFYFHDGSWRIAGQWGI